jgi:hypothetical protein
MKIYPHLRRATRRSSARAATSERKPNDRNCDQRPAARATCALCTGASLQSAAGWTR